MGSCCGKNPLLKYKQLYSASKLKTTSNGKVITTVYAERVATKAELQKIMDSTYVTDELRTVLSLPYSSFDRITPSIYLTSTGGMIYENIYRNKITCIINTTFEAPGLSVKGIEFIRVPVDDDQSEDLYIYFDDVADKLNEVTEKNSSAVVHCVAGISRSTTFVLAYLIKYKKMNLKESFDFVRQRRPVVQPKSVFLKQLIRFEKKILKESSVTMVIYEKDGYSVEVPDFYEKQYPNLLLIELAEVQGFSIKKDKVIEELNQKSAINERSELM